ncbi:MAG: hypothetical protein ACUVX1_11990 [Chloroflexota bacterium]
MSQSEIRSAPGLPREMRYDLDTSFNQDIATTGSSTRNIATAVVIAVAAFAAVVTFVLFTRTWTLDYYKFPWTANVEISAESETLVPQPIAKPTRRLDFDINDKSHRYGHTLVYLLLQSVTGSDTFEPLLWPIGVTLVFLALFTYYRAALGNRALATIAFALGAACILSDFLLLLVVNGLTDQALGFTLFFVTLSTASSFLRASDSKQRLSTLVITLVLFWVTLTVYSTAALMLAAAFGVAVLLVGISSVTRQGRPSLKMAGVVAGVGLVLVAILVLDPTSSTLVRLSVVLKTAATTVPRIFAGNVIGQGTVYQYEGYSNVAKMAMLSMPALFIMLYLPGILRRLREPCWHLDPQSALFDGCYLAAGIITLGTLAIGWTRVTELNLLLTAAVPPTLGAYIAKLTEHRSPTRLPAIALVAVILTYPLGSLFVVNNEPPSASRQLSSEEWGFARWAASNLSRHTLTNMKLANAILILNHQAPVDVPVANPQQDGTPKYDFLYAETPAEFAHGLRGLKYQAAALTQENLTRVMQLINYDVKPVSIKVWEGQEWDVVYDDGFTHLLHIPRSPLAGGGP